LQIYRNLLIFAAIKRQNSFMKEIHFTKMHGLGNDYIYINCMEHSIDNPEALSIEMSPRHTAIGSDGIILILPSEIADFKMRIFNADGSEAKMCGNGSRCVGKYVYDHKLTDKTDITLETNSGVKRLILKVNHGSDTVEQVTVDMGAPSLQCDEIPVSYAGQQMIEADVKTSMGILKMTAVSMGNPHGVIFVDDIDNLPLEKIGRELEIHPMWPDRANIEFVKKISDNEVAMRVWERGSGETMACGTGACAVAVASMTTNRTGNNVTVNLRGGALQIALDKSTGHIMMTGPAEEVFTGVYKRK
jgi:diaminopimelate epimerase